MMGLHSPSWSSGKLPLSGGIGFWAFCPPPGPPKLMLVSGRSYDQWFVSIGCVFRMVRDVVDVDTLSEAIRVVRYDNKIPRYGLYSIRE